MVDAVPLVVDVEALEADVAHLVVDVEVWVDMVDAEILPTTADMVDVEVWEETLEAELIMLQGSFKK